jgi:hypothetical protein
LALEKEVFELHNARDQYIRPVISSPVVPAPVIVLAPPHVPDRIPHLVEPPINLIEPPINLVELPRSSLNLDIPRNLN